VSRNKRLTRTTASFLTIAAVAVPLSLASYSSVPSPAGLRGSPTVYVTKLW